MPNWSKYIEKTKDAQVRELLVKAMSFVRSYNYALDFGAGGLRDTKFLLKFPFKEIHALDKAPDTKDLVKELNKTNLICYIQDFNDFIFESNKYSLVNAQFSLPFVSNDKRIVKDIIESLEPEGVFVGNFFGVNDDWNDIEHANMTFHTKDDVLGILSSLKLIYLEESLYKKQTSGGKMKNWHVIDFIGLKEN